MVKKITYENKVAIQNDEEIPRKNKVTDADLNEIKETVNNNAEELENKVGKQEGKELIETELINKVKNLNNYDDTEVKQDIAKNTADIANLDLNKASKTELQEATIALQAELLATRKDLQASSLEGQAEGESLYLQDSSDARFREFGIGGNDKQDKREGYNLLNTDNLKYKPPFSRTVDGVTETYIGNGQIKLNGTATKQIDFYIAGMWGDTNEVINLALGNYTASCLKDTDASLATKVILFILANGTTTISNTANTPTFAITDDTKITGVLLRVAEGTVLNNCIVEPMIYKGTDSKEYEQYGAMPSLKFPSEVKTVKDSANVTVCNKNLCDNIFEQGVIAVSNGKNGPWNNTKYIRTKNYIKIKPNTQFVMTNPIKNRGRKTRFYDKDKNYLGYTAKKDSLLANNDDATLKRVSTMPDNAYYLRFELDFDDAQIGQDVIDGKYKYQLEEGNTATDYIAHEEQTFTIDVQQEMLEGDYFDLDNEEEVHTWGKKTFIDNSRGWFKSSVTTVNAYGTTNRTTGLPVLEEKTSKCTHAKYSEKVGTTDTTEYVSISENLYLCFPLNTVETLDDFKTLMQEQVDNGTPVTIYYKLEEPTKIPFNSAQKAVTKQIKQLHSYKGGTHVYSTNNPSATFNVKHTKDAEAYIQAEINKMQAMILAGEE